MSSSSTADLKDRRLLALQAAETARSRSLRRGISSVSFDFLADADQQETEELDHLTQALSRKSDELVDLMSRNSDRSAIHEHEVKIDQLENELEALRSRLEERSPMYSAVQSPHEFDLDEFRTTALSRDDLLLEYSLGSERSYLWLVSKDDFEAYSLPPRADIETMAAALTALLNANAAQEGESFTQQQARIKEARLRLPSLAHELSSMILGPIAEKLHGKRLIVVPDGKLNYFPIGALPIPNSDSDDPIILTNEVIYQPSAQTYALLKNVGKARANDRTKDLLVFSDPVFSTSDERLTGINVGLTKAVSPEERLRFRFVDSFSSLSRLRASRTEAETITKAVGTSDLFTGFDATRERLLSTNLSNYRVVHLATHGFLDMERPELSSLIFSRYDQRGSRINESIRLNDIYSMKLNADLVVLSACQTGTGKEVKGEGVIGLDNAFLQVGARSVVSTLWQVEDNATNELMKEFYTRMVSDGMSPSAALRAAQIKLFRDPQFHSPFFWAAFTVHGDALSTILFERDHTRLLLGVAAALVFGLIGSIWLVRRRYRTLNV